MTKTHAQILADIAADIVRQYRDGAALVGIVAKPHRTAGNGRGHVLHDSDRWDIQARIAAAAAADHTPDWDYRLDERWQG